MHLPPVIFGTSCLGNIYEATSFQTKLEIVAACVENAPGGVAVFDSAGKYGAGLALESLGKCLEFLHVPAANVLISNKLGWYRVPLTGAEPTFEKGVWKELEHDAVQRISYDGILACFEQGNSLLGNYPAQMVSVHDPDEYLDAADSAEDAGERYEDIIDAYRALFELKAAGRVQSVGVGAKNWKVIRRISESIRLDWVMIANSITLKSHPSELLQFVAGLHQGNVTIINSAVFNGGFLIGSDFYNYAPVDRETSAGAALYKWREAFFEICKKHHIQPAEACFSFGFKIPGIDSVALSTTKPAKVAPNVAMATSTIPPAFWENMVAAGLLEPEFLFQ